MRLFLVLGVLLILISGCLGTPTGSSVMVEDVLDKVDENINLEPVEAPQPKVVEEEVKEEPEAVEEKAEEESEEAVEEEEKVKVIEIKDRKFIPETLTVKSGTMVVWKHLDVLARNENQVHLIRIYPGGALSPRMEYGDEFEYTFTEPKEYRYIDIIHKENMKRGIVVVE